MSATSAEHLSGLAARVLCHAARRRGASDTAARRAQERPRDPLMLHALVAKLSCAAATELHETSSSREHGEAA
jgi:hypothetical protein